MINVRPVGDVYSIALQGMRANERLVRDGASKVAFGSMDHYADAFVEIMRGSHGFRANLKVVQAQREMDRSLLDIIA